MGGGHQLQVRRKKREVGGGLRYGEVLEDYERGKPTGTWLASDMADSFCFLLQSCSWQETPNFAASDASLVISSPEQREIDI